MDFKNFVTKRVAILISLPVFASVVFGNTAPSLKDAFAGDFLIGVAINRHQVYGRNRDETGLILTHFNSLSPENLMKWAFIHPNPNQYRFDSQDAFVKLGTDSNMFVVGHTLIWHQQTPAWVFQDSEGKDVDRKELLKRMKTHITTVVSRYKGRVKGWDVVNEAIAKDGCMRPSKWQQIIGDDFIEKAFEYAHAADPNAELYYNDYSMVNEKKRAGVIAIVNNLQTRGIQIDGVGIQGHWALKTPEISEIEKAIQDFAALGVKVMITELDVTVLPKSWENIGADVSSRFQLTKQNNPYTDGLPDEIQQELTKRYADIMTTLRSHSDVISRVTFWNLHDGSSWRNNWPVRGRTDYPLLFDRQCKPKPAFYAVVKTKETND